MPKEEEDKKTEPENPVEDGNKAVEKKLDEALKSEPKHEPVETKNEDIEALKAYAIKGMLSELDKDTRAKVEKLVVGKSITDAAAIIDTFKDVIEAKKKPDKPVGGVPAPNTKGTRQSIFDENRGSPYKFENGKWSYIK